ncbi:MAG: hypothetical protein IPG87_17225 [Saprospiraceae bacterium]|nr:hypothetical protein [Candidatus Vicinibacter affinis]
MLASDSCLRLIGRTSKHYNRAGVTVKVAVQVLLDSQELVTVKVTVATPPHLSGAGIIIAQH